MLSGKRILLVIGGGIAAYKSLDLIRRLRERGASVRCIVTQAATNFVTPLSVSALSEDKVYGDIFSLTDESEMGHIRLSREADLIIIAPATGDLIARLANGIANDLATTAVLAADKAVLLAPTMNHRMWLHPATQANLQRLEAWGARRIGPSDGAMACGEHGPGRMAEPLEIVAAAEAAFRDGALPLGGIPPEGDASERTTGSPLAGLHAVVTSGPTREPIDPVRFIANRSSGKQGHAIARALASAGARVTLVSGPVSLAEPPGVEVVHIESAREMLTACEEAMPADIVVCAAAVADWRVQHEADQKIKKNGSGPPTLTMAENPDILATLARRGPNRPGLVVGFAAETENVVENAVAKRTRKECDWMLANDVSPATGTFGGDRNSIHFVTATGTVDWPLMTKAQVADRLVAEIAAHFGERRAAE